MRKSIICLLLLLVVKIQFGQSNLPDYTQWLSPASSPTLPSGFDGFDYNATGFSLGSNVPQIAEYSRSAGPDESIILTGHQLSFYNNEESGKDMRFITYGVGNVYKNALIQHYEKDKAAITIDASMPQWSMYLLWAGNENGFGAPVALNKTEAWWKSKPECYNGQKLSIYGRNLAHHNDTLQSWVYIEPENGNGTWANVIEVNPYKVDITIPDNLPNGSYKIWVHNGHGGNYGWSAPLDLIVVDQFQWDANEFNIQDFGAIPNDTIDDTDALMGALYEPLPFGVTNRTVYIPAGVYVVSTSFFPSDNLRIRGDGKDISILRCANIYSEDSYGMALTNGLYNLTLQDMTFDANRTMTGYIGSTLYLRFSEKVVLNNIAIRAQDFAPIDLHGSYNVSITHCDWVGQSSFFGTANQVIIDSSNFYLTNDTQAALYFWGCEGVSVTNSTCQDFDNSDGSTGDGWGEGRFVAVADTWNVNRHHYYGHNATNDLTVRPDHWNQNAGEQYLWEGGNIDFRGNAVSASSNTVTFDTSVADISENKGIVVSDGKGLGQIRIVTSFDTLTNTVTVDRPWNVLPDVGSRLDIGKFNDRFVFYNNYMDGKPRAVSSPDHIASSAVQSFGGTTNLIVANNTIHSVRAVFPHWGLYNELNGISVFQPSYFNSFINNKADSCKYGYANINGWFEQAPPPNELQFLGTVFRNNQFDNVREGLIGFAAQESGTPIIDMSLYENNSAILNDYAVESSNNSVRNQIFRKNNFQRDPELSYPGNAVAERFGAVLRENSWSGYDTLYSGINNEVVIEAPYHVIEMSVEVNQVFDTLFTLYNSGKIPYSWQISDDADWLNIALLNGTISDESDSDEIDLSISTTGLAVGNYYATMQVTSGVDIRFYTVILHVTPEIIGVSEEVSSIGYTIVPNPTAGSFKIKANFSWQRAILYDALGKEIRRFSNNEEMSLDHLDSGLYWLSIYGNGGYPVIQKIVKQSI
jgi:hypothetical protein